MVKPTPQQYAAALKRRWIKLTKIGAARRQLGVAIHLWFADDDPVSIHTLAAAAHQIIHDLNSAKKGSPLLFDASFISKRERQKHIVKLKEASNFFKHAERGKMGQAASIDFSPTTNEMFLLISIFGLKQLGETLNDAEIAFVTWFTVHRPDVLTDTGRQLFEKQIPVNLIEGIKSLRKKAFFELFLQQGRQARGEI